MSSNKEYSPEVIAQSFIKQYYELIATNPNELYRFYKDDSFFTHTEGHQTAEVFSGTDKIRARVKDLNLAGARFDLSEGSVDAHKSENAGIFVLVTGHCTPAGEELRQFVQSFFLAVQTESPISYYVRNSVLRLFPCQAATPTPAPVTVSTGVTTTEFQTVTADVPVMQSTGVNPDIVEEAEVVAPVDVVPVVVPEATTSGRDSKRHRGRKETSPTPVVAATPSPEPEDTMIMESVVVLIEDATTSELTVSSAAETAALQEIGEHLAELAAAAVEPAAVADSGPKSYADLFKRGAKKEEAASAPAHVTASATAGSGAKKGGRSAANGHSRNADNSSAQTAAKSEVATPAVAAVKPIVGNSLFVKNLPVEITEADLLRIFDGALRADIHSSKGYGFIEFSEPVFAASTMTRYQEDPSVFSHSGQRLKVEERGTQPKTSSSVPSKGSSRGGGGGRNDKSSGVHAGESTGANTGGRQQSRQGQGGNSGAKRSSKGEKGDSGWAVKGGANAKK